MVYNICNFFLIYVMVIICSSYTFAPWTTKPIPPREGTKKTCHDWLIHHHFKRNNNTANQKSAILRNTKYDHKVSYFAAAFAYLLSNMSGMYSIRHFGPSEFCELHTINYAKYFYIALKDAVFTCEGWIHLYLYLDGGNYNYKDNNNCDFFNWAHDRDVSMDNKISLWAALYFKHITSNPSYVCITPKSFCRAMGKDVMNAPFPSKYPFLTFDGSQMSCTDCIEMFVPQENVNAEQYSSNVEKLPFTNIGRECYALMIDFGFTDDNLTNYFNVLSESFDLNRLNPFARDYIFYVKEWYQYYVDIQGRYELLLQHELMNNDPDDVSQVGYIIELKDIIQQNTPINILNKLLTPKIFCKSTKVDVTELLRIFTS